MTASSSTVLANLSYLIGAVVVAAIGALAVWLHHRQPRSADATMESFRRGLDVIAPESGDPSRAGSKRELQPRIEAQPGGRARVNVERPESGGGLPGGFPPPARDYEVTGEQPARRRAGDQAG